MTDVVSAHRPSSRQGSPVPRRQLGVLPVNQRSYSRLGSKGAFGDESPLMSPLPYYPRRRSVTFAEEQPEREERPNYNAAYATSAPVSPVPRRSPPPVSILKTNSSYPGEDEESGAAPASQAAAATVTGDQGRKDVVRSSPVPTRGRSNSRQRLAARRKEAQLHHSFYEDSLVEDYVLSAKTELEKEEAEERRVQNQLRAEQEKAKKAERRGLEANEKISALQHAKEVLRAATVRRQASATPSPSRVPVEKPKRASSVLRELEGDSNPAVQAALKELARSAAASQQQQQQRSRIASTMQPRRRSMPIVSADALAESDEDEDDDTRKRSRLERIVSKLLAKKGKSKSKRSLVVINWSDSDVEEVDMSNAADGGDHDDDEESEAKQMTGLKRQRSHPAKSRSAVPLSEATLVPTSKPSRKASAKRASSSRKRHISAEPDLGDSLLFENDDEQPILLPRRQHTRPAPTRSISHIDANDNDTFLRDESSVERVVRRPPRATRAPPTRQRRATAVPSRHHLPANEMNTSSEGASRGNREAPFIATASAEESHAAPPRQRRATAPRADPTDPMAVFFEAAFPSPSKFDEMMMQAGGLPESRRGGGGRGGQRHQPNLVLPSSIGRRR